MKQRKICRTAAVWFLALLFVSLTACTQSSTHGFKLPLLHEAAFRGNADAVESLLSDGVSPTQRGDNGTTALHWAASGGHDGIARRLLAAGATVSAKDSSGRTPLHYARTDEMLLLLHDNGADPNLGDNAGVTVLHNAKGVKTAQILLDAGANPRARTKNGGEPLSSAARIGNPDLVRLFLSLGADSAAKDKEGRTALHAAARGGHIAVIDLLVAHGADVNVANPAEQRWNHRVTPLHLAALRGRTETMRRLLELGADIEPVDGQGFTPLERAVSSGHVQAANLLLSRGADPSPRPGRETLLHLAAASHREAMIGYLLERGANPNARGHDGRTPLHAALTWVKFGRYAPTVQLLLEAGADANARTDHGVTALQMASSMGQKDVVKLLLDHGATSDTQGAKR